MVYTITYLLLLVIAVLFPVSAVLYATYTRVRRKGYSPPTTALILTGGMALGVAFAIYLYPAEPAQNIHLFFLYTFFVPLILMVVLWVISIRLLPLRQTRIFGVRAARFPFVKVGYIIIAIAVIVSAIGIMGLLIGRGISTLINALVLAWGFLFPTALYCFHLDRQRNAPGVLEVLEQDPRKPVLYLRAFNQESQFFVIGPKNKYGDFTNSLHARLAKEGENVGVTFEEYFGGAITESIGPFVALGSPEDYIPPQGATRMYATDADWMQRLTELAQGAACILVEVGKSSNLRREFEQLGRLDLQHKLFVITRPGKCPGTRLAYAFYQMIWRLKGIETVSWEKFSTDMRAMNYKLNIEDPGPGAVVGFDYQAKAVCLVTGADLPGEYVDAIRRHL